MMKKRFVSLLLAALMMGGIFTATGQLVYADEVSPADCVEVVEENTPIDPFYDLPPRDKKGT